MSACQSTLQNHPMDDTPKKTGKTPAEIESKRQGSEKETPGMIWVWDDGSEARAFELKSAEIITKWDDGECVKEIQAAPKPQEIDREKLMTLLFGPNPNGPDIFTSENDPVP